jgi:hypothetical protein
VSAQLHSYISSYFSSKESHASILSECERDLPDYERLSFLLDPSRIPSYLRSELLILVRNHPTLRSGLQVARICHGLGSPGYPSKDWRSHPLWGAHCYYPFESLCQLDCFNGDSIAGPSHP